MTLEDERLPPVPGVHVEDNHLRGRRMDGPHSPWFYGSLWFTVARGRRFINENARTKTMSLLVERDASGFPTVEKLVGRAASVAGVL